MEDTPQSMLLVLLTQLVTLAAVVLTHLSSGRLSKAESARQAVMRRTQEQLSEFYGPLRVLLVKASLNHEALVHVLRVKDEAVATAVLTKSVLPTNRRICEVVSSKIHLLDSSDTHRPYFTFLQHAEALGIKVGYDSSFPHIRFPLGFREHVEAMYETVRREHLRALRGYI